MKKIFILDSGAYTAWSKGAEIDIDAYISFCLKNEEYIDYIVNLDVIPGEWGKIPTKQQCEDACKKGFENYYYMLEKGIKKDKLVHVFHQGDSFDWLIKMMEECTDYIGISPANDKTTKQKIDWLDEVFGGFICDNKGYAKIRTHGFGVTSFDIMKRYPWWSCDSTTWVNGSRFGYVFIPRKVNGIYLYTEKGKDIFVSNDSSYKEKEGKHYDNLSLPEKAYINEYLKEHDLDIDLIKSDHYYRCLVNIIYFLKFQENISKIPYNKRRFVKEKGLFDL